jgi:hypothetical protein
MDRKSHILRANKHLEYPSYIIFFDTETEDKKINSLEKELNFKIGWLCYWDIKKNIKKYYYFNSKKKFWNFVFSKSYNKRKLYLIAHNLPFDFRILKGFKTLSKNNYRQEKLIFKGTTNIFKFRKGTKTLMFIDNMNFFNGSLQKLGENMGLSKLNIKKDNLKVYCKRDVEIMVLAWKFLLSFLKENNLGNFAPTIAGQSFNAYRHRFMKEKIFIHTNLNAIKMERESYHGGRVESFRIGKMPIQDYFLLDVNSMYPSVMSFYDYPSKLIKIKNKLTLKQLKKYNKKYALIAEVSLITKEPFLPIKIKNKTFYPIGKIRSKLTTREIDYALNNAKIKKIGKTLIYEKRNLFNDYVKFFFTEKQKYKKNKNESLTYLCKIFLNSLYGKFGQKIEYYQDIGKSNRKDGYFDLTDIDNNIDKTYRVINGNLQEFIGEKEGYESFVAIPATITADARIKLWKIIKKAGIENVYYCDTDSVIVNTQGFNNLKNEIGDNLGQLSLQEKNNNLKIYGLKDYVFGEKIVIKGIRKNAIMIGENKFSQEKFEGLNGAIRNDRINKVIVSKINKNLKRQYDKGKVKGNRVYPFKLDKF